MLQRNIIACLEVKLNTIVHHILSSKNDHILFSTSDHLGLHYKLDAQYMYASWIASSKTKCSIVTLGHRQLYFNTIHLTVFVCNGVVCFPCTVLV